MHKAQTTFTLHTESHRTLIELYVLIWPSAPERCRLDKPALLILQPRLHADSLECFSQTAGVCSFLENQNQSRAEEVNLFKWCL